MWTLDVFESKKSKKSWDAKQSRSAPVLPGLIFIAKYYKILMQSFYGYKDRHYPIYNGAFYTIPFDMVRAGLHWLLKISKQILPLLLMLGW